MREAGASTQKSFGASEQLQLIASLVAAAARQASDDVELILDEYASGQRC